MQITQKRLINLSKIQQILMQRKIQQVKLAIPVTDYLLKKLGFKEKTKNLTSFLPKVCGPVSRYNAEGGYVIHKDLPKEPRVINTVDWHWTDWNGTHYSKLVDIEKDCYLKLANNGKSLLDLFSMTRKTTTPYKVIIKGTAYNWICAYDHIPYSHEADGTEFVSKELKSFHVGTQDEQYFAIAVLNSKIEFWVWTVIGDGFHITNNLFSTLRISKDMFSAADYRRIIQLGQDISYRLVEYKNITINSGKTITNYNHLPLLDLISEIDNILCNTINAPEKFSNYLSQWYFDFITCGRNS